MRWLFLSKRPRRYTGRDVDALLGLIRKGQMEDPTRIRVSIVRSACMVGRGRLAGRRYSKRYGVDERSMLGEVEKEVRRQLTGLDDDAADATTRRLRHDCVALIENLQAPGG